MKALTDPLVRGEITDIGRARPDAVDLTGMDLQLAQVERQQILGSLLTAIADARLEIDNDRDLPLIGETLLRYAPQTQRRPDIVARTVLEFVDGWHLDPHGVGFLVGQLAAGLAYEGSGRRLTPAGRVLAEWLAARSAR